jgi:hypothetical protein
VGGNDCVCSDCVVARRGRYIRKLIMKDLSVSTVEKVLRQLRKLPWPGCPQPKLKPRPKPKPAEAPASSLPPVTEEGEEEEEGGEKTEATSADDGASPSSEPEPEAEAEPEAGGAEAEPEPEPEEAPKKQEPPPPVLEQVSARSVSQRSNRLFCVGGAITHRRGRAVVCLPPGLAGGDRRLRDRGAAVHCLREVPHDPLCGLDLLRACHLCVRHAPV